MTNQGFDALKFRKVSEDALIPAAEYVRSAILGEVDFSEFLVKGDKTAVTIVDKKSQEISRPIIQMAFPQFRLNQEESNGEFGNKDSDIVLYHDPLDGTGGFLIGGATPTIILAAYDSREMEILACSTLEPSTGRFWFSSKGNGAYLKTFDYASERFDSQDGRQIHVNGKEGLKGSHVLVDIDHGFERTAVDGEKRRVLFPEGRRAISRSIETAGGKTASFYTNGGHYAYVATGNPTLIGNITTAIGGPFDIAGMLHVTEAGGVSNCYRIYRDARRANFLGYIDCRENIELADSAIAANNESNLKKLERILLDAAACFG